MGAESYRTISATSADDRRVLDRLSTPELQVAGREVERSPAELVHPDLERNPGGVEGFWRIIPSVRPRRRWWGSRPVAFA